MEDVTLLRVLGLGFRPRQLCTNGKENGNCYIMTGVGLWKDITQLLDDEP